MPLHLVARLVQAFVVVALVAGTTAFVGFDKTVTVSVDGEQRQVRTFARTVGDVLDSQRITVGRNDLVAPAPAESLESGSRITVRYGRPLQLTVDGVRRTIWTTARSVDEALMMLGLRGDGAVVSASRSTRIVRAGLALDVRLPHNVTLLADGKRSELTTTVSTVGDALREARIAVRPADRLNVAATAVLADEQVIAVTRVDGKRVVQEKPIAYRTVRKKTRALFAGVTRLRTKGKVGAHVLTWSETYVDRKLSARTLLSDRVAVKPVTQVILVGTRPRPANSPSADGLNWAGLARCESGGNPKAYNSAGPYYGLYQFSASTWRAVGGSGVPTDYGAAEQTYRAQLLYRRSGAGQWPVCGRYL